MTANNRICAYCHTKNPIDKHSCLACGAPLPKMTAACACGEKTETGRRT